MFASVAPWAVLLGYAALIWWLMPTRVSPGQFYGGESDGGKAPGVFLLVASAAISWLFAKSIANAASLGAAFGIWGGIGYALYYLSFAVAAVGIYFIRVRGGYSSLSHFLTARYGSLCAKLFLTAIAIRLFNEVWSNTKVTSLYFGEEGSSGYWISALAVTSFTVYYSFRGGLRSSLLTDAAQMVLGAVLLIVVLVTIGPGLVETGLPDVDESSRTAGMTFCCLALVQVLSYPFHDPVLTDRAFITSPKVMVKGFLIAGVVSAAFILLFSGVGLYAASRELTGPAYVSVPSVFGLPMLLVFNAIMLTSAGSTLDSTFTSAAKLSARDWHATDEEATAAQVKSGRWMMVLIAIFGNLPLLSIYLPEKIGPAVIAATTISGTMVMGLAPIFLLPLLIRNAGSLSFHLAFWPGLIIGSLRVIEFAASVTVFPAWLALGSGKYSLDLGLNVFGLLICCTGYLVGAVLSPAKTNTHQSRNL